MDIVTDTAPVDRRPSKIRSCVSNGTRLLPLTDGRSAAAWRFKDLVVDIGNDLGGLEHLSETQRQLVRRASMLSAESERLEASWARGEESVNIVTYATITNALRRVAETIGLKRVPRPVNDGSTALTDYFGRPPPKAEAAE